MNTINDKIEIPLSRTKLLLLLVAAGAFVFFGGLFVSGRAEDSLFATIIGMISIVFFGFCFIFIFRKLFDQNTGLTIDAQGITDHSSGISVGLIEWADITNIYTYEITTAKLLMIEVADPKKYIQRSRNNVAKKAMRANLKFYGTPLSISANSLKVSHEDLESMLLEAFKKWAN